VSKTSRSTPENDVRHLVSAVLELIELLRLAFSTAALRRGRQIAPSYIGRYEFFFMPRPLCDKLHVLK
jgi:hypothetical protein